MHRIVLAAAILLLTPATALAVTTQPAQPPTISESGTGAPKCSDLPYTVLSRRHKVILRITHVKSASATAVKHIRLRGVPAGNHTFHWCGHNDLTNPVVPGTFYWRVGAVATPGAAVGWSRFRHVVVTA